MKTVLTLLLFLFVGIITHGQGDCTTGGLNVSDLTTTQATLRWKMSGPALYLGEYGLRGFTYGSGIKFQGNTNIKILQLRPDTEYDFYVRKRCVEGNYYYNGPIAGPFTFSTASPLEIKLFPNPTFGPIEISANELITEIKIYNNPGQELFTVKINDFFFNVDLSDFDSGLYLVKIFTDKGIGLYKVVKE